MILALEDLPVLEPSEIASYWHEGEPPAGELRLLTVQDTAAWATLGAGELLRGSPGHVDDRDVPAYAWMVVQLERQGWDVVGAPVWGWCRMDFPRLVQDWPEGAERDIVVIVADVPEERALVSAFDPWHELVDELDENPNADWERCLDLDAYPDSPLQAVVPFLEIGDVVKACRLRL